MVAHKGCQQIEPPSTPARSQGLGSGLWMRVQVLTLCMYTAQGLGCCCHDSDGQHQASQDHENPGRGMISTHFLTYTDPHSHSQRPCHGTSTCLTHWPLYTAPPTPSHLKGSAKGGHGRCSGTYGTHWHPSPPHPPPSVPSHVSPPLDCILQPCSHALVGLGKPCLRHSPHQLL